MSMGVGRIAGLTPTPLPPTPPLLLGRERGQGGGRGDPIRSDGDGAAASAAGPHRAVVAGRLATLPPAAAGLRLPPAPLAPLARVPPLPLLLRRLQAAPRLRRRRRGPLRRICIHGAHPPPRRPRRRIKSHLHVPEAVCRRHSLLQSAHGAAELRRK